MTDLDAEVAAKIMDWSRVSDLMSGDGQGWWWRKPDGDRVTASNTPHFSTDISDAWSVVEVLSRHPDEAVRRRFRSHLLGSDLLVDRDAAAKNICIAALSTITSSRG